VEIEAFLEDDYELKVRYLTDHMQRMWTRFNFFITIQSGLVGGLVFTSDGGKFTASALYFLIAEAALSVIWWVFGAQDRHLVVVYRGQIEEAWSLLSSKAPALASKLPRDYRYAGETAGITGLDWHSPLEWRWEPISTTRLPALVPLLLLVFWLVLIALYVVHHH
jgi:hypothetical protein